MVGAIGGATSTVKPHIQRILEGPAVVAGPRQEGGGDGRAGRRGDVEEGAAATRGTAGGAPEGRRRDAGEVDAQRESGLLQGLFWHGEGLQLLLPVGHVGVLAAAADAVQTRLEAQEQVMQSQNP